MLCGCSAHITAVGTSEIVTVNFYFLMISNHTVLTLSTPFKIPFPRISLSRSHSFHSNLRVYKKMRISNQFYELL